MKKLVLDKGVSNAVRLLAAIGICATHYYPQYYMDSGSTIIGLFCSQCGYFGVAIFFFLSGFGLMESDTKKHLSAFDFFKRRLSKIYVPVILVTILWLPLRYNLLNINILSWGGVIKNLTWSFADGILWYIQVLLILYVVFYAYAEVLQKNRKIALISLVIFAVVMTSIVWAFWANYAAISIPIFFIGITASLYKTKYIGPFNYATVALLVVGTIESIFFFAIDCSVNFVLHGFINYLVLSMLLVVPSLIEIRWRIPAYIGAISFDIYLIHNKVMNVLNVTSDFVPFTSFIGITVLCALLFYIIRTKFLKIR